MILENNTRPYKAFDTVFIVLITVYQWTVSPDHGILSLYTKGVCKFYPSCSEYTKQMIIQHGSVEGFKKGFDQFKKCH